MLHDDPNSLGLAYQERLYEAYLRDPMSVPEDWRSFFQALDEPPSNGSRGRLGPSFEPGTLFRDDGHPGRGNHRSPAADSHELQQRVDQLIRNYRVRGHMIAHLDPLGQPRPEPPDLDLAFCGLSEADLDRSFSTPWPGAARVLTLRQILERLRNTYCRSIGVQFMHIDDLSIRQWLQTRMEETENHLALARPEQLRILQRLTDAVVFEQFVQKRYIGAKSFSLEGGETLIPLLDLAIEKAASQGIVEIVLGMAHRGRLNVLTNIVGKPAADIFRELEDADPQNHLCGGDVMYHLGYSTDWRTAVGPSVHVSLCFNPSHLEFINPVAEGRLRAKQDRASDFRGDRGMVLLIHGDASFAGEGIVQETLNLSQLPAYSTGGTLHVIINNQIGFVTPPEEARSAPYASDAVRMLQLPIFHVNGEDPEAVAQVVRLAMDFRERFRRDVMIDMYCYRRRGHSEGDEPAYTQPLLYQAIARQVPVRDAYFERLLAMGGVTQADADEMIRRKTEALETAVTAAASAPVAKGTEAAQPHGIWRGFRGGDDTGVAEVATGVNVDEAAVLLEATTRLPDSFHPHHKLERWLTARREMAAGRRPLDWAAAEALAFASLAAWGYRVRMSGQDCQRGTFSQRHAVFHDVKNDQTFCPLAHLTANQAPIQIFNSPLSEGAVMGFEYGYSLDWPDGLVLWEAQYGDFANAAQVVIDQFITSAEKKWNRLSGLVLLLPHGFEGHGPEHSSARIERWVTLAADHNIRVVYPTTPAQFMHVLRRQVLMPVRKPLVVFTSKGQLRDALATSSLEDCAAGTFQPILADKGAGPANKVRLVLLCSGRVFYDLYRHREELKRTDVAIVRMEQLYPLPAKALVAALKTYPRSAVVRWVQEEPRNMGAWRYLRSDLTKEMRIDGLALMGVTRPESASPATGSIATHRLEQKELITRAFEEAKNAS